jgi:hypothetical protein
MLLVSATSSEVKEDANCIFNVAPFIKLSLDGEEVDGRMWRDQSVCWTPNSACKRSVLMTTLSRTALARSRRDEWHIVSGLRLYNYVFFTAVKGEDDYRGVICMPRNHWVIKEVLMVSPDAVMLLCRQMDRNVTVCIKTAAVAAEVFANVEALCRCTTQGLRSASLQELLADHGLHPQPHLSVPGHFARHVVGPDVTATQFDDALLVYATGSDS